MKKLLTILFLVGFSSLYSQSLVQTYTDRCTGETKVYTVPMGGQTTVVFYNRARSFTSAQFQSGELQSWLEETYLWWSTLNPCSTATTNVVTTQATTQATTEAATQAAASAAAAATQTPAVPATPPTTPPPTQTAPATTGTTNPTTNDTSTQNTTANTSSSGSTDSTGGTQSSDTGSTGGGEGTTSNDSGGTTEGGSSDGGGAETETKTEETKTEETKTEETKSEESKSEETKEEVKEEKKEETKEESKEEKKEEKSEEEKKEEEKEEKKKEKEEKKKEKKEKKKDLPPPIIAANVAMMQGPDGSYSYASTFGVSRSSLMGDKTYGINTMVWSNLQQFMLNANYTQVHINKEGRPSRVYSASIGGAKMFSTVMGMMNHSVVFLGKKGSAAGVALGSSITSIEFNVRERLIYFDEILAGGSITGFYTKPIPTTDRLTLAPMLAISSPFVSYSITQQSTTWNKDLMFIGGLSGTFNLTKRFGFNLGVNAVTSTIKDFPVLINYTIGSRFSF